MARHHIPVAAAHLSARSEQVLNLCLVTVTGYHEWGNIVGYAALPLALSIILHLVCGLLAETEGAAETE
jgi:hypothetical protein